MAASATTGFRCWRFDVIITVNILEICGHITGCSAFALPVYSGGWFAAGCDQEKESFPGGWCTLGDHDDAFFMGQRFFVEHNQKNVFR